MATVYFRPPTESTSLNWITKKYCKGDDVHDQYPNTKFGADPSTGSGACGQIGKIWQKLCYIAARRTEDKALLWRECTAAATNPLLGAMMQRSSGQPQVSVSCVRPKLWPISWASVVATGPTSELWSYATNTDICIVRIKTKYTVSQ